MKGFPSILLAAAIFAMALRGCASFVVSSGRGAMLGRLRNAGRAPTVSVGMAESRIFAKHMLRGGARKTVGRIRLRSLMGSALPPVIIEGGEGIFEEGGKFDPIKAQEFLGAYWQKRCVLIRNAFPFSSPVSPDELAGLACEEEVESRVVIHWEGLKEESKPAWEAKFGPFTAEDFGQLPETHYTLLVQEVNRHVPEVNQLLDRFRFIPNWRVDDIMVSYASLVSQLPSLAATSPRASSPSSCATLCDQHPIIILASLSPPLMNNSLPAQGGGVGPHTDSYDVFLVQGLGVRQWSISHSKIDSNREDMIMPDVNVRVLKSAFKPDETWDLSPGDVLYIPPGAPHWGTSLTEHCMTYSVGFRAPCIPDAIGEN